MRRNLFARGVLARFRLPRPENMTMNENKMKLDFTLVGPKVSIKALPLNVSPRCCLERRRK